MIVVSLKGITFIDGIVGTGISIWIAITGIKIFKKVLVNKSVLSYTYK